MFDTANVIDFPAMESMETQDYTHLEADLKNGHAPIANAYLEKLASGVFTLRQMVVIMAVMRLTYGEKDYEASKEAGKYQSRKLERITATDLAELTGYTSQRASSILNELIGMNVVKRVGGSRSEIGMNNKIHQWILPEKNHQKRDKNLPQKSRVNPSVKTGSVNPKQVNSVNPKQVNSNTPIRNIDTRDTFISSSCDQLDNENLVGEYNQKPLLCDHPKKPEQQKPTNAFQWQAHHVEKGKELYANGKDWPSFSEKVKVACVFYWFNKTCGRKSNAFTNTGDLNSTASKCLSHIKKGAELKDFKMLFSYQAYMSSNGSKREQELWGEFRKDISTLMTGKFDDYLSEAREHYGEGGDS